MANDVVGSQMPRTRGLLFEWLDREFRLGSATSADCGIVLLERSEFGSRVLVHFLKKGR